MVTEEVLADGDLLLYQVVDDTGEPHDTALARVLEVKRSRGHTSLVIKFLAAKADDYHGWAEERFNEKRDCHLHLCRGKVSNCKGKPTSKALGWVHSDGWRLASYHSVCSLSWCRDAAVDDLGHMVNRWIDFNSDGLNLRLATGESGEVRFPWGRNVVMTMDDPQGKPLGPRGRPEVRAPAPSAPSRVPGDFKAAKAPGVELTRAKKLANEAALALRTGSPQVVKDAPAKADVGDEAELSGEAVLKEARAKSKGLVKGDKGHDRPRDPSWMDEISATGDERDELVEVKGDELVDKRPVVKPQVFNPKAPPGRGEVVAAPRGSDVIPFRPKRKSTLEVSSDEARHKKGDESEKKRRKRRRKDSSHRRRRDSSRTRSQSEQSQSSDGSLYGRQSRKYEPLSEKARKKPGRLLKTGLEEMSKFLARRLGEDAREVGETWRQQRVGAYISQVMMVQYPNMGVRNSREVNTLSMALDALLDGDYATTGDLLMQRLKAVETSLSDGWRLGEQQELIPPTRASLTSAREREFAARQAVQAQRLDAVVKKKSG